MIKIPLYDVDGKKKDDVTFKIDEKKFEFNEDLVAQAVLVEQSRILNKYGRAKTKGEVRGGGKKPWRQKGTGRARAGSLRSPLFKGGGVTFGPTGQKKILEIPQKMREAAFLQLILKRTSLRDIVIVEGIKLKSEKTKDAASLWSKISGDKKSLIICDKDESSDLRPFNNLAFAESVTSNSLMLGDLLKDQIFIFTRKGFGRVERMAAND